MILDARNIAFQLKDNLVTRLFAFKFCKHITYRT